MQIWNWRILVKYLWPSNFSNIIVCCCFIVEILCQQYNFHLFCSSCSTDGHVQTSTGLAGWSPFFEMTWSCQAWSLCFWNFCNNEPLFISLSILSPSNCLLMTHFVLCFLFSLWSGSCRCNAYINHFVTKTISQLVTLFMYYLCL